MADFKTAYNIVFKHEGGYQNIESDSGNYNSLGENVGTNWGINAKVYESWIGKPPSKYDMAIMSKLTARNILFYWYWMPIKGNDIKNQEIANILFDGAVNHGVWRGVKMMQEAVGTSTDGKMGPVTLGAINSGQPSLIYNQYKKIRTTFYYSIVNSKPSMKEWLPIWIKRINSFTAYGSTPVQAANTAESGIDVFEWLLVIGTGYALLRLYQS